MKQRQFLILLFALFISMGCRERDNRIQPWSENPWFWQFKGEPLMLLGASGDDNLFQWPEEILIPHLDSMVSVGANYVRNTMSDRVDKGFELYPYKKLATGKYDLNQWNEDYWNRFEFFLRQTEKRDIIVQIEIWDRFDYSRDNWPPNPYNPKNNVNYSASESGLEMVYPDHPGRNKQPFFFSPPLLENNEVLLNFQKQFVEKLLSISFQYNHVLYCMDNETSAREEWAVFWAEFVRSAAGSAGHEICLTEMWDNWDLKSEEHKRTFDHPERYDFCDVSQNNQQKGQVHYDNFRWVKNYLAASPRPLNTVKTYGADGGRHGNTKNGLERWWRHVTGGAASARFHRPPSGLGLSGLSMASVKAARQIEDLVPYWELQSGNHLLSGREENEAYLSFKPEGVFVLFFTNGGKVQLDLKKWPSPFTLRWMNIRKGEWAGESVVEGGQPIAITAPGPNEWVAVILPRI